MAAAAAAVLATAAPSSLTTSAPSAATNPPPPQPTTALVEGAAGADAKTSRSALIERLETEAKVDGKYRTPTPQANFQARQHYVEITVTRFPFANPIMAPVNVRIPVYAFARPEAAASVIIGATDGRSNPSSSSISNRCVAAGGFLLADHYSRVLDTCHGSFVELRPSHLHQITPDMFTVMRPSKITAEYKWTALLYRGVDVYYAGETYPPTPRHGQPAGQTAAAAASVGVGSGNGDDDDEEEKTAKARAALILPRSQRRITSFLKAPADAPNEPAAATPPPSHDRPVCKPATPTVDRSRKHREFTRGVYYVSVASTCAGDAVIVGSDSDATDSSKRPRMGCDDPGSEQPVSSSSSSSAAMPPPLPKRTCIVVGGGCTGASSKITV